MEAQKSDYEKRAQKNEAYLWDFLTKIKTIQKASLTNAQAAEETDAKVNAVLSLVNQSRNKIETDLLTGAIPSFNNGSNKSLDNESPTHQVELLKSKVNNIMQVSKQNQLEAKRALARIQSLINTVDSINDKDIGNLEASVA